jgi:hypothetical protein
MINNWRKAVASQGSGSCVETGWDSSTVGYRDTKQAGLPDSQRPTLVVPVTSAQAFIDLVRGC